MNITEGCGLIIAACITAATAIIGVFSVNKQKSFEVLTKERIKQLNDIRSIISKIRFFTSVDYICDSKNNNVNIAEYQILLLEKFNSLKKIMTGVEQIESNIFHELDNLNSCALAYYDSQDDIIKEQLEAQQEFAFSLIDIYDWSLWQYIQKLYKGDRKLSKRFDIIFLKNYYHAYSINSDKQFFKSNGAEFVNFKDYVVLTKLRKGIIYCTHRVKMWFFKVF